MRFSIIIPAKNEESNIRYCLESLKTQAFPAHEYEVIVVDNGSSDATVSIAKGYGFRVYVQPHLSLSGLRNFGTTVASGEILVFLDADCIPTKDWLQNISSALEDSSIGATGSTPVAPPHGTWVEIIWSSFRTRRKSQCYATWINSSNFIVRRDLFVSVNGFNENLTTCEDVDICMRLNKICTILFDPFIKVVHLGEPKTVREFFLKEIWRGKGALSGLFSHGFRISEFKSMALPLYYFAMTFLLLAAGAFKYLNILLVVGLLYLLPAAAFAVWIVSITKHSRYFFGYAFLFLLYANARAVALFLK